MTKVQTFFLLQRTKEFPHFEMRGKKYFVIFDPPHLLKSVRNNLLKYKLEFGHKTASWDGIKSFYQREHELAIRMAPKLTEKPIDPDGKNECETGKSNL